MLPTRFPETLLENAPANAACPQPALLDLLARRRSTKIAQLTGPGPDRAVIEGLLGLAARTPDHGKLAPWRFLALLGEGRARAGACLAEVLAQRQAGDEALAAERQRFLRAPAVIGVISTAAPHAKIPEWEQLLSAGAVCFNLLLAAHGAGYAGCWLTEWPVYDAQARAALGLAAHERIAGFIYLGSASEVPLERPRPDSRALTSWF